MTKTNQSSYAGILCVLGMLFILPLLSHSTPFNYDTNISTNDTDRLNNTSDLQEYISKGPYTSQEYSTPHFISNYNISINNAHAVYIENTRLYFIDSLVDKFFILDISNPLYPKKLAEVQSIGVLNDALFVDNGLVYIGTDSGMEIWDCSDPSAIGLLGGYYNMTNTNRITVSNDICYITSHNRLDLVNVSEPVHPFYLNHCDLWCSEISIREPYAYMLGQATSEGDMTPGLKILNITDPTNSSGSLRFVYTQEYADVGDLFISDDLLVITDPTAFFMLNDISDPVNPVSLDSYDPVDWMGGQVCIESDFLYIAKPNGNIDIYNISNPINILPYSTYIGNGGSGNGIQVKEGIIYLSDGPDGIEIIDSTIRDNAKDSDHDGLFDIDEIIYWETDPFLSDSDFDGCSDYLEIEMSTDPNVFTGTWTVPKLIAQYSNQTVNYDKSVFVDNYIYTITGLGIEILRYSGDSALQWVNCISDTTTYKNLEVFDDYLMFYGNPDGTNQELLIYDISTRDSPVMITNFVASSPINDIEFVSESNQLFVATNLGIEVVDMSDFSDPILLTILASGENVHAFTVFQNQLFYFTPNDVTFSHSDISSLFNPVEIEVEYSFAGSPEKVWQTGSSIYFVLEWEGLFVINCTEDGEISNPFSMSYGPYISDFTFDYDEQKISINGPYVSYLDSDNIFELIKYWPLPNNQHLYSFNTSFDFTRALSSDLFCFGVSQDNSYSLYSNGMDFDSDGVDNYLELYKYHTDLYNYHTDLPSVSFSVNSTSIYEGEWVEFTDTTHHGTPPYTYEWNFGDGSANSSLQHPTHQYLLPGTYTITLSVWDTDGDYNSTTRQINVIDKSIDEWTVPESFEIYLDSAIQLPLKVNNVDIQIAQEIFSNAEIITFYISNTMFTSEDIENGNILSLSFNSSILDEITPGMINRYHYTGLQNGTYYIAASYSNPLGRGVSNVLEITVEIDSSKPSTNKPENPFIYLNIPGFTPFWMILASIGGVGHLFWRKKLH